MAIKQVIWSLDDKCELPLSSLTNEHELENLIADNVELLSEDWLLIGRQVRTQYSGIIDLLCIDASGNPVVIELKKGMTPREVTAQALDYASCVNEMDADDLAKVYLQYSEGKESLNEAFKKRFGVTLGENNDDISVQVVIVATDMDGSTERIIKYLQGYGIDINVLFFSVFEHQGERFLSRAWMFEPNQENQLPATISANWNGEYYFSYGVDDQRSWEDAMQYGFVSAGGGPRYTAQMQNLEPGNRIWVNIPRVGYVGVGTVLETARPASETLMLVDEQKKLFFDLKLKANYHKGFSSEKEEYIVKIDWQKTVSQSMAISEYGFFGNQNIVCRPKSEKWEFTVNRLKDIWKINN